MIKISDLLKRKELSERVKSCLVGFEYFEQISVMALCGLPKKDATILDNILIEIKK